MASLISESRTWRWMFLGALWYLCFLLLERHKGEGFERHVLLIKGILSAEVRPSPQLILPLCHQQMPPMFKKKQKNKEKKKSWLVLAVLHYRVFGINSSQHFFHRLFQPEHYCSLPPQSASSPHIQTCQFSQSWQLPKDGTSAKSFNMRVQRWKKKMFQLFLKSCIVQ